MVDHDNLFVGRWALIPELCQYQDGTPPPHCVYEIAMQSDCADITLHWTDKDGKSHSLKYGGPADGSVVPFKSGHVSEMSFSKQDAHTLDSSSYAEGREVNYARRKASSDGELLSVQIVTRHNGDAATRNFQIFRRLNSV